MEAWHGTAAIEHILAEGLRPDIEPNDWDEEFTPLSGIYLTTSPTNAAQYAVRAAETNMGPSGVVRVAVDPDNILPDEDPVRVIAQSMSKGTPFEPKPRTEYDAARRDALTRLAARQNGDTNDTELESLLERLARQFGDTHGDRAAIAAWLYAYKADPDLDEAGNTDHECTALNTLAAAFPRLRDPYLQQRIMPHAASSTFRIPTPAELDRGRHRVTAVAELITSDHGLSLDDIRLRHGTLPRADLEAIIDGWHTAVANRGVNPDSTTALAHLDTA